MSAGGFYHSTDCLYIGQVICPTVENVGLSFYRLPIYWTGDLSNGGKCGFIILQTAYILQVICSPVGLSFNRLPIYWTGDLSDGPDAAGDDQRGCGHAGLVRHHQPGGGGGEPRGSARLEHRPPKLLPCQNQCCGSVTFWNGSGSGSCYFRQ